MNITIRAEEKAGSDRYSIEIRDADLVGAFRVKAVGGILYSRRETEEHWYHLLTMQPEVAGPEEVATDVAGVGFNRPQPPERSVVVERVDRDSYRVVETPDGLPAVVHRGSCFSAGALENLGRGFSVLIRPPTA